MREDRTQFVVEPLDKVTVLPWLADLGVEDGEGAVGEGDSEGGVDGRLIFQKHKYHNPWGIIRRHQRVVLQDIDPSRTVEGDKLNIKEVKDLNRGRMFLKDLADAGDDVHLFTNIKNAVQFLVEIRREKRAVGSIYK